MYSIVRTSSKHESVSIYLFKLNIILSYYTCQSFQIKIKDNLKSELKFIIKFGESTKPVNDLDP